MYRILCFVFMLGISCTAKKNVEDVEWRLYGNEGNNRYSPLAQIDSANVLKLQPAWEFSTGDIDPRNNLQLQCHPIMVNGKLYVTSGRGKVYALNAATGEQVWSFDALKDSMASEISRGVVYWEDENTNNKRIFFCARSYLYALDARSGELILGFGDSGRIDLRRHLDREDTTLSVVATTPGVIYKDLLIMGGRVSEGPGKGAPGHIRAFNVLTGKREWIFHTIPHPGEYGYDTWPKDAWKSAGGANNWTGMTVDHTRGTVFIPLGSPAFDFYGGDRKGINLFGNCLVALDAATGKRKWHFQTVHHDLWDRDLPAPPNLVRVKKDGKMIDAVAQVTKTGFVFIFNRDTGESLFPIEERPVPKSSLPGEEAWPTQPYPTKPEPFVRQLFRDEDISVLSPETKAYVANRLKPVKRSHMFEPPSTEGTVILPGFDGGAEWGGAAFDEQTGTLYVNGNEMAWILTMVPRAQGAQTPGRTVYLNNCAGCHGAELKGAPPAFPSLDTITPRLDSASIALILNNGRGRMNAFKHLPDYQKKDVIRYLLKKEDNNRPDRHSNERRKDDEYMHDYLSTGYHRFIDMNGYPALSPPWGTLNAIDLNEGKIKWTVPLGEIQELTAKGIRQTGTENYGGPLITASGLLFIGSSKDEKFRAFDTRTGKTLWEYQLPAGGYATPTTYQVKGRQYIVIAAGGGKMGTKSGNKYIAFALRDN